MGAKKKLNPRLLASAGLLLLAAGLSACGGGKEKKPGQALASVNGEEITVLQLNEELQRANVQAAQQEAARKQLLEALIDRQLLQIEAAKDKTDRDPAVVQSIERAKALIIAQAYMQKRLGTPAKPTQAEVEAYYTQHPEFFAQRKALDMRQLVLATRDLDDPLKAAIDSAKSLDEVAAWMDAHKVKFVRNQVSRTSSDLPAELARKLLSMPKGQLFIVREGERSLLISIAEVKDSPVSLEAAASQIEQFLVNKKNKDAAAAELARLRAAAKITYLNKADEPAAAAAATPAPAGRL
ncbi:EpsD family peptidyl-prolyl cis-trans isomerase, partial [Duganella radicis]